MKMHSPAHPGVILREYMGEALTVSALALHLGMNRVNLSAILNGRLGVSAAVAIRLSEAFPNTEPEFWLNLQTQYDLAEERKAARKEKRKKIKPVFAKAA